MSPEVLRDQPYDYKADTWSLGIIFYMLVTLENPLMEASNKDQMLEMMKGDRVFKSDSELKKLNIKESACILLKKMLRDDPGDRIDFEVLINESYIRNSLSNTMEFNQFTMLINHNIKDSKILLFKVENMPELHDLVFFLVYYMKDYFLDITELFRLNEFYKYFDTNNDGIVEIEEIESKLIKDGYNATQCQNYGKILKALLNCDFRRFINEEQNNQADSIDYDFFITSNIILNMFKFGSKKTLEKTNIMFKEIDEDGNGTLSIDELKNHFSMRYEKKI